MLSSTMRSILDRSRDFVLPPFAASLLSAVAFLGVALLLSSLPLTEIKESWVYPAKSQGGDAELQRFSPQALRIRGAPERTLASIDGTSNISVGYFNAALAGFPVAEAGQNLVDARGRVLEALIASKLLVREAQKLRSQSEIATLAGADPYAGGGGMARRYLEQYVANLDSDRGPSRGIASERDAFAFLSAHPDTLSAMHERLSEDEREILESVLRDRRLNDQRRLWRQRADVRVAEELLAMQ